MSLSLHRIIKTMKVSKLYLFIILFVLSANILFAQDDKQKLDTDKITLPVLDNHKFIVNNNVRSPFIKTYFSNLLGIGQALDLKVPILEIDGDQVFALRGTLYFLNLGFEYQYAVTDWLAVWLQFAISSRVGDGAQTLLAQGINATTNFEFGWMFKLMETKKTLLSGTVNLWNNSGTVVNIYDYIKNIIDEGALLPDNQLIITRNFIQLGGGLRFAWAASDLFGVNLRGEFAYGESVNRKNKNELYYVLAASTDFDLNRVVNVPIGFVFGIKVNSFVSGSDISVENKVSSVFLKTAYTGEDDFLIGLDFLWRKMPLAQMDQTLYGGSVFISLDYYF
jgi:hypothetical protein